MWIFALGYFCSHHYRSILSMVLALLGLLRYNVLYSRNWVLFLLIIAVEKQRYAVFVFLSLMPTGLRVACMIIIFYQIFSLCNGRRWKEREIPHLNHCKVTTYIHKSIWVDIFCLWNLVFIKRSIGQQDTEEYKFIVVVR